MENRQSSPGMEGRVLIIPEGNIGISVPNFYARVQMADNPTVQGTPWAKESVLTDETAALFGLDASAVPNDVFQTLKDTVTLRDADLLMPQSAPWYSVAYGNGRFVAVAANRDQGAYSDDGINWLPMDMPFAIDWRAVTYGNGRFVAVANYNTLAAYSDDGITWKQCDLPVSQQWRSVTYGNGKFVAVAYSSATAAYSTDGITWQSCTMPASRYWYDVVYGNDKFVAVATSSSYAAYSTDGITWTTCNMPISIQWRSVTYGNGKFVAVAYNSTYMAYSADGITWTRSSMPATRNWSAVAFGNGRFVAIASSASYSAYSTDGINWTTARITYSTRYALTYGNGRFVSPGYSTNKVSSSENGAAWNTALPSVNKPDGTPLIAAMQSILGLPGIQIETGEYIGTGSYGYQNPTVITCSFYFKIAIVYALTVNNDTSGLNPNGSPSGWVDSLMYVDGQTLARINDRTNEIKRVGNTLSFGIQTGNDPAEQLNESGETYRYIFIG